MSINSDLQQINVFSKGMNTDTSDAYLSTEQYRFAQNLRFFTDSDANSGELRQIEGCFTMNNSSIESWITTGGVKAQILKIATIRDYGIVITKDNKGWSIWASDKNFNSHSLIFGPCTDMIGDNISIVTRYESDKNIKVYIADGKHQLMSVNLIDKKGNYRNYGSDIKDIISDTEIPLMPLTVSVSSAQGSVKGPVVQYAYTLYTEGGVETQLSPLSNPLSLYDSSSSGNDGENTNKAVSISIRWYDKVDYSSYKIKIYRISYVQNGQLPDISLIYDGSVDEVFTYTDTGFDISQMSTSEFIALNSIKIKPLLIESKNDYLFAANIDYDQQQVDKTFEGCTVTYTPVFNYAYDLSLTTGAISSSRGEYRKSFKRGETYRFGIVFHTKDGKKSSVMYIKDVDIPNDSPFVFDQQTPAGSITAKPACVEVTIDMPKDVEDECAGYEIVRCKRTVNDSRCITQGIIGRAQQNTNSAHVGNVRIAQSYMTMDHFVRATTEADGDNYEPCKDLIMFASPEYAYQPDDVKNIFDSYSGVQLRLNCNYSVPYEQKRADVRTKLKDDTSKRTAAEAYIVGNASLVTNARTDAFSEYSPYGYGFYEVDGDIVQTPVYAVLLNDDDESFFLGTVNNAGSFYSLSVGAWASAMQNLNTERKVNFSLLYPVDKTFTYDHTNNNNIYDIANVGYAETPDPKKFDNGTNVVISDDTSVCGTLEFINWDAVDPYSVDGVFNSHNNIIGKNDLANDDYWHWYAVTSGKRCVLLHPKTDIPYFNVGSGWTPAPITVADVIRTNVTPYGGDSDIAKQQSVFYSFGDYYSTKDYKSHNTIHSHFIYSGDTYLSIFEYNSAHCWDSPTRRARMYPTVYMVPIESSIDLRATYGDLYSRLDSQYKYYMQDVPCSIRNFSQEKRAYLYNTAYSITPDILSFTKSEYNSIYSDKYDCRVYYSNLKTNGENTDSWLKFKSANFIDVDTRYGEITQMKLFKDTLVFWQERATGILSVNERTLIRDANDVNIILGNGDVLQRYDYLTTEYGMKAGDKSDTQSNNALYWWDSNKKDILQYPGGNQVLPLKVNKTVSNYINAITSFAKRPKAEYDNKYQEIMFNISTEGPLVYNEMIQQFTGVYTRPFDHSARFSDSLILFDENKTYKWNKKGNDFPILLKYVVNKNSTYTKTFDNMQFGMGELFMFDHFYNGENDKPDTKRENRNLKFKFKTPLKQTSETTSDITNREYDLRMPIPRDKNSLVYGGRMRGRTMQCEISADASNNLNFSLQYIITKFRISWS